jgi:hypothetical protein
VPSFSFFQLQRYLCKSILCATIFGFTGTKLSYGMTNPSLEDKNDRNKTWLDEIEDRERMWVHLQETLLVFDIRNNDYIAESIHISA